MLKHVATFFVYSSFFFLIAIVFAGDFANDTLLLCALIAGISALSVFLTFRAPTVLKVYFIRYILFAFEVLIAIYVSTFNTIRCYIKCKGKIPTHIEKLPLHTNTGTDRLFICQAITLTPGTVSVNSTSSSVSVLKIKTESLKGSEKFDKRLGVKK